MSRYLVQIALGPVQDFIFQARRMRDIWFGSHILSELSRAVARTLASSDFTLVFPSLLRGDPELERCQDMRRPNGLPPLAISNIILGASPDIDEATLQSILEASRAEAIATWKFFANRAYLAAQPLLRPGLLSADIEEAIEGLLEFIATWEVLPHGYQAITLTQARAEVASTLAARKVLRDFDAWPGVQGLPKSSLDGFRETFLIERPLGVALGPTALSVATRYRIPRNEQLDAVGIVKRCGGRPDQFVPLSRVALEPWISAIREFEFTRSNASGTPNRWDAMVQDLKSVIPWTSLSTVATGSVPWLDDFPFDGEVFFEGQWPNHPIESADNEAVHAYDTFIRRRVQPLLKGRTPDPYIACLVADGDRMGESLDLASNSDGLDPLGGLVTASRGIANFARAARGIIEAHQGVLIFAGGDDVLAFLPLNRAVACSEALRLRFEADMEQAFPPPFASPRPTLSVGLGLGHVLEPMRELIERGRKAEAIAKRGPAGRQLLREDQRNALAVVSARRGGHEVVLRRQWSSQPARMIHDAIEVFLDETNGVPNNLPYEVRSLLQRLPTPREQLANGQETVGIGEVDAADTLWAAILRGELRRTLTQKSVMGLSNNSNETEVDLVWQRLGLEIGDWPYGKLVETVSDWLQLALVVRHLSLAQQACRFRDDLDPMIPPEAVPA